VSHKNCGGSNVVSIIWPSFKEVSAEKFTASLNLHQAIQQKEIGINRRQLEKMARRKKSKKNRF
jgi:hypothetical protein